jgi:Zn-dependent peptidase ImmA (M78 family)
MNEMLPINREILTWARITMGLSIEDVSAIIHKEPHIIASWEDGLASPTYPQLEKLADDIYKRPVALFFFPRVPEEDSPKSDFRSLPGTTVDQLPPSIIKMYRKAKILQFNIEELYDGQNPSKSIISNEINVKADQEVIDLAKAVRERLGISIEVQKSWKNMENALKTWRDALEMNGIFVFKDAFYNDYFSGFCLHSTKFPVIFLNNTMSKSRQIFTLFHELAHLMTTQGGIDFFDQNYITDIPEDYLQKEYFCNSFAGEFLVPSEAFVYPRSADENYINEISSLYSVSREVIARKLLNNKSITNDEYNSYVVKWNRDFHRLRSNKSAEGGGNIYYNIKSYLGAHYIDIAFSKYYKNIISSSELADYLFMKEKNLSTAEHYMVS